MLSSHLLAKIPNFKAGKFWEISPFILQLNAVRLYFERNGQVKLNLFIYLFADKENMVKILIDNKIEIINLKNGKEKTPLFLAIEVNGEFPRKNFCLSKFIFCFILLVD